MLVLAVLQNSSELHTPMSVKTSRPAHNTQSLSANQAHISGTSVSANALMGHVPVTPSLDSYGLRICGEALFLQHSAPQN